MIAKAKAARVINFIISFLPYRSALVVGSRYLQEPASPNRPSPKTQVSEVEGDPKSRGSVASNAGGAAPCTSTRHTCDAGWRPGPSDPGIGRSQRDRNASRLREMQRQGDRAKHRAANEHCSDDYQLFHESSPAGSIVPKAETFKPRPESQPAFDLEQCGPTKQALALCSLVTLARRSLAASGATRGRPQ